MSDMKKSLPEQNPELMAAEKAKDAPHGLSRRHFLSASALAGFTALGLPAHASTAREFKGWPDSFGVLTDLTACVGCRSCERACNEANGLPAPDRPFEDESVFKESRWPSSTAYTVVNRYEDPDNSGKPVYRKVQCNHCLEPACATACPIQAYTKTPEGAVLYNENLCFGCRYCVIACPFNMPGYAYESAFEPKIVKCIMCHGRIKEGGQPACTEACPAGALTFGRRADLIKLARKRIADQPEKYVDHIYGEREAGGTSWMYISGVPFERLGFPTNLPNKPLIELSKGYLSAVPAIFTTFPAIFGMVYGLMKRKEAEARDEAVHDQNEEVHHNE